MNTAYRRFSLIILVMALLLFFAGCSVKDDPEIRADVESFLGALRSGDADAAYALVYSGIGQEEFDTAFAQMHGMVSDLDNYELTPIQYNYSKKNSIEQIQLAYRLTSADSAFLVTATSVQGYDGLVGFYITPEEQTTLHYTGTLSQMQGANAAQWIVLAIGALTWVYTIWLIVDCCRRKIRRKPLWILILLCCVLFTVSMGNGSMGIRFNIGLYLKLSSLIRYGNGAWELGLMFPVGAIVYHALRRKLTIQHEDAPPLPQPEEQNEGTDGQQIDPACPIEQAQTGLPEQNM